jgi:ribosomal protein S21
MIEVRKKEGETTGSFLFSFNKRVKRSGVMKETRKRRYRARTQNRTKRRNSTLYRVSKHAEIEKERKYGGEPAKRRS